MVAANTTLLRFCQFFLSSRCTCRLLRPLLCSPEGYVNLRELAPRLQSRSRQWAACVTEKHLIGRTVVVLGWSGAGKSRAWSMFSYQRHWPRPELPYKIRLSQSLSIFGANCNTCLSATALALLASINKEKQMKHLKHFWKTESMRSMNLNTHIKYFDAQPEILYIPAIRYM